MEIGDIVWRATVAYRRKARPDPASENYGRILEFQNVPARDQYPAYQAALVAWFSAEGEPRGEVLIAAAGLEPVPEPHRGRVVARLPVSSASGGE